ncbi:hypothetical protein OJAV_G00006760 [Oryzias javanicus]|uniref:Uncharacterized protein n=1 Tax=Oryzias javanicus TaxID=123683 RepID=A0A437DMW1_ORYJA|nr:hypothetical protein OJAV_G00006760 [Oryzias javanicus]
MEFPEDFNQLELLDTHGHLIPRGGSGLWTESKDEEKETDDEDHSEEWYLAKEVELSDKPAELVLWAAENNRLATLLRLLAADPLLVHCRDEDNYTPLHRAAYNGHVEAACALLSHGSDINPRTIDGWTPCTALAAGAAPPWRVVFCRAARTSTLRRTAASHPYIWPLPRSSPALHKL